MVARPVSRRLTTSFKIRLLSGLFGWFGHIRPATRLRIGAGLGWLALKLARSRVSIARKNLELCFPHEPYSRREQWLREHFRALGQSIIDRGVLWYGPPEAIRALATLKGVEQINTLIAQERAVIMLAPHFIGLDVAGTRLMLELPSAATMYTSQSDPAIDAIARAGRTRFNEAFLVNRKDGPRELVRHLRAPRPLYYLPDMDFGRKGALFVPFFGIQAATIPATAQLARKWNAAVLPILAFWEATTGRYAVEVLPPLPDFPGSDSLEVATARLNRELETWIQRCPSQYYWVHRRFKTRPPGEAKFY
jgi:KDO2-lipid IV(A) lauroyltransferase